MMFSISAISPASLLVVSGVVAGCCVVAALTLLRHLARLEARLRAVEASTVDHRPLANWLAVAERLAGRCTPGPYRKRLQRRLMRARIADRATPERIILIVLASTVTLATLTAFGARSTLAGVLFPIYFLLAALVAGLWLDRLAAKRRQAVQNSLPATLDLLVLAMEAGLSLDAALREVVAEWHSAASRELEHVAALTGLGMSRGDAFRDVAESLDLDSLRRLAGRVTSAERLGTSLVLILRTEAEEARRERRTAASRKVAQAPTKILIPTALLILPVTLIVLLGPALPQIVRIARG